jgi:hypothetical protein
VNYVLLPCTCLPSGFAGLLIHLWFDVWLSRMFLLERKLVVWQSAIMVVRGICIFSFTILVFLCIKSEIGHVAVELAR